MKSQASQLGFRALLVGDVRDPARDAWRANLRGQRGDAATLDPHQAAVLAANTMLVLEARSLPATMALDLGLESGQIFGMHTIEPLADARQQVSLRRTEELAPLTAEVGTPGFDFPLPEHIACAACGTLVARLDQALKSDLRVDAIAQRPDRESDRE